MNFSVSQSASHYNVTQCVPICTNITLTFPLAAEIVNAFQSSALQTQWEKLQTSIITSHNERITDTNTHLTHIQNEITQWRTHNNAVQSTLDEKLDSLNSKFADKQVEVGYDVQQLEKRIGKVPVFGEERGTGVCLEERMGLIDCYNRNKSKRGNGNGNGNVCDEIVKAMERCAKKAVMA
jgi:hypothetical protein